MWICWVLAVTVMAAESDRITGPRPLGDVADRLQAAWRRPVTYEEPVWLHASDASMEGDPLRLSYAPLVRTAVLPGAALTDRDRRQDLAHLRAIVAAFNRDYAPLEFAVTESNWGLHIVPVRAKDRNGNAAAAKVVLNEPVNIGVAERTPLQHIEVLARTAGVKSGIRVDGGTGLLGLGFDRLFTGPNKMPLIPWGTHRQVKGRDALLALLAASATTFSWRLKCQPPTPGRDAAFCVLSVDSIPGGRQWDRCPECRELAPPPPPPPPGR